MVGRISVIVYDNYFKDNKVPLRVTNEDLNPFPPIDIGTNCVKVVAIGIFSIVGLEVNKLYPSNKYT